MASVASAGASPLSSFDYPGSTGDPEDSPWTYVSAPNSASPGSAGFFPSPGSGALGSSWGVIGHASHHSESSLPAASPLSLDTDLQNVFVDSFTSSGSISAFEPTTAQTGDSNFFSENYFVPATGPSLLTSQFTALTEAELNNLINNTAFLPMNSVEQQTLQTLDFSNIEFPDAPWSSVGAIDKNSMFVIEDPSSGFVSPSPSQQYSPSASPQASASPQSPHVHIKREDIGSIGAKPTTPIAIRKVRGDARVTKKKKCPATQSPIGGGSGSSSMFLIVTPDSVNAHADKSNPFDCHDAMRSSQRGRKGPLANETKESALKVRRLGACFHCHARKVKCGEDRACGSCLKLQQHVPHAMCWQFDDFDAVLFPDFIRGHFAKDKMSEFIRDNIAGFTINGVERPCTVELFSGTQFNARLSIKAKFFTAKTDDVVHHYHLQHAYGKPDLQRRDAAAIGLETEGNSHKEELRKKLDKYIQAIVAEPAFAEMVTDSRHTRLPRTLLRIVQDYAQRSDNVMVKRALSIYAMHYVMGHHLCLTQQSINNLGPTGLVPLNVPWVTPRVLNRQLKAVLDDMMRAEMTKLFKAFGSSLKPKERKGWAPCLAAFLVLTLFMESVEQTVDTFVITENQIALETGNRPVKKRSGALSHNAAIENMPFKQVGFQFHQLYQTHLRDAGGRSFNPMVDDVSLDELDRDAAAMVMQLRRLLQPGNWSELDYLTADPILPYQDKHPIRDVTFNYVGRLCAKFILSFEEERYIIQRNG
ncbi:hypothetical protein B0H67DRAFT_271183 [Lasiosphaeris hirsuta]|uniref:Zn(2)-C6 fungal-type domain-containing protein n=1 Tax=Lasiosphaeris hirsuta TaxID=260670 RepID=A0AA40DRV6_9PEZI|nr:hypothetical protein B0H67DRAFT_271183 [Lasiosphaeris hirsuta]